MKRKQSIPSRWRSIAKSALAASLLTLAMPAFAQFNETEPNDTKATANAITFTATGETITGLTTSSSGAGLDYYLITLPAAPLGVYENTIVLNTTTNGHTLTIRGLTQTAGVINAGTDATILTGTTSANTRTIRWYSFGKGEQLYIRVSGTASTTANYTLTWNRTTGSIITGPTNITEGSVNVQTKGQTSIDTDFWIYNSNFDAIPGWGGDDTTGGITSASITRTMAAGTYYVAAARYNLANNQASTGADEAYRSGPVLDFPGAVVGSSATAPSDLDVRWNWGTNTFVAANSTFPTQLGVAFTSFTVVPPATPPSCASGLVPANAATNVARNASITWSAAALASSYDVYFGTSTNPPLVTNTTSLTYSPAVMAANTQYYYKIVPKNLNGDASGCSEVMFTTGTDFVYCTPTYSTGCGSGDAITNVTMGALNNTSACTPNPFYTFYNAVTVPNITQGEQSTVSVTFDAGDPNQFAGVWIDYNQDGDFSDAGEFVANNTTTAGAGGTAVFNITVPPTALTGQTRMRIRGGNDSQLANTPCGTSSSNFGETEDYIVNVLAGTPCVTPSDAGTLSGPTSVVAGSTGVSYSSTGVSGSIVGWVFSNNGGTSYSTVSGATSNPQTFDVGTPGNIILGMVVKNPGLCLLDTSFINVTITPAAGDDSTNAIQIGSFPYTDTRNTAVGYSTSAPTWTNKQTSADIYYKFTVTGCSQILNADLCTSSFDTYMHLLSSNLTPIESDDDDCTSPNASGSVITNRLLQPGTYYIVAQGFNTNTGTYTLNATLTPSGIPDEPACAAPLTLANGVACSTTGTTVNATVSSQTNSCGSGADVWYSVQVPVSGHLVARLNGGTLAGRSISIFSNMTTEAVCSSTDRAEATGLSAGTTAFVRVSGTTPGTFNLLVNNGEGVTINWTGAANTDWFNPNNWSLCAIPDRTINVNIPTAANQPTVGTATGVAKDLYVMAGATLTIPATGTVSAWGDYTMLGTLSNNGTLRVRGNATGTGVISGTNRLILEGTGTQTLGLTSSANTNWIDTLVVNKASGAVNCNTSLYVRNMNVSASNTVTLPSAAGIFLGGTLTNAGSIATSGRLTIVNPSVINNTGTVTVGVTNINNAVQLNGNFTTGQINQNAAVTGTSAVTGTVVNVNNSWSGNALTASGWINVSASGSLAGNIMVTMNGTGGLANYGAVSTGATVVAASSGSVAYRNLTPIRKFVQQSGNTQLFTNLMTDSLTIDGGYVNAGSTYTVMVNDGTPGAVSGGGMGYVNGKLRRNVSGMGTYDFPVSTIGKGNNWARVTFPMAPSLTALEAVFYGSTSAFQPNNLTDTNGDMYSGAPLNNGNFNLTPIGGTATYDLYLYNDGFTNASGSTAFTAIRTTMPFLDGTPLGGSATVVARTGLTNFGTFVTGKGTCGSCRFEQSSTKPSVDNSFAVTTYPNPTSGNIFVDVTTENAENVTISVANMIGQVVRTEVAKTEIGQNQIGLDLSAFPAGIYTVTVQTATQKVVTKVEKVN